MPPVGFEPTISTGERPKTYALYRAVTGTDICMYVDLFIYNEDLDVLIETFATNRKGKHISARKIPGNLI